MSRVVLDAAGGDHAPGSILDGVSESIKRGDLRPSDILLTGPADAVRAEMIARELDVDAIEVHDAPDELSSSDSPVDAMRKKPRNSIAVAMDLVAEKKADAFVSAGNTGLVVATAMVGLRRLEGIRRPGIAVTIEGASGPLILVDVGANPQPKAIHLLHYGLMGSAYYEDAFGKKDPRVGLMNIGSEDGKGSAVIVQSGELLRSAPINFVGNIEGVDVFGGKCDVIVCDGFAGNVLIKVSEGLAEYLIKSIATLMGQCDVSEEKQRNVLGQVKRRTDYSEYGGALLLGVAGIVTICHGRSGGAAISNAIRFALKAVGADLNEHIVAAARSTAAQ